MSQPDDRETVQLQNSGMEDENLSPAEAFALVGNDTRMEILQALLGENGDGGPVSFSELFGRIDIADSAHFNYHLGKLTDHYIRRTEEGYEFRYAGWKVVRAVFAGTFNERAQLDQFEADGMCYDCRGSLKAWYADEMLTIECIKCGARHVRHPFPPGGLDDRTPEELLQAFHHHVRHHYCLAADGVCPECLATVETTLVPGAGERLDVDIRVDHVCERCHNRLHSALGLNLLDNPDVLTFHAERGVDLSTEPFWHFDWCVSDKRTTILSDDPLEVRVDIPCDGDELRVTLDEDLSVLNIQVVREPLTT